MASKVLIMMSGIPGSGKSTWALKQAPFMSAPVVISRDAIRKSLMKPGENFFAHETRVFNTYTTMLSAALNSEYYETIFADATQLNWVSRKKVINALKIDEDIKVTYILINMNTSLDECLIRNMKRKDVVPDKAIFAMNKRHSINDLDYEFFDCIYNIGEDGKWVALKNEKLDG